MSLLVSGVSHKTAPIELREHLVVPAERLTAALADLRACGELRETVVLSTCNRLEVYARAEGDMAKANDVISRFFRGLYEHEAVRAALYHHSGPDAVRHLFRVAAGLESLVVGETDILGQVKSAYLKAQENGATGKITNVLFQRALFVGKVVRNQTNISEGGTSVGSIAVQLAESIFGRLDSHRVLIVGAGKMAEVTARHLVSQKPGEIVILNRTVSKAEEMARQFNGRAGAMETLVRELEQADIVICSTSSAEPIVTRGMVEGIMKARKSRSLYFIDIAVPRNVEASTHELDNVFVYNIDDLQRLVNENMAQRERAVGQATELVNGMAEEFRGWLEAILAGRETALRHHVPSIKGAK